MIIESVCLYQKRNKVIGKKVESTEHDEPTRQRRLCRSITGARFADPNCGIGNLRARR